MPLVPDEPVPMLPDEVPVPVVPVPPDAPVPIDPLVPDEPVPIVPVPVPVPMVPVPVPMLPLPEVPLEPEVPLPVPVPVPIDPLLLDEPLVPSMLPLLELLEPVVPLLLEPELLLCFLACFFLVDFLWVGVLVVLWSCAVALVPVEELPLVCAWAVTAPHIAIATDAPSRPFNNLFIFMSLS
jgi:signal-induced proliferation-associated 1 like protein 3